MANKLPEAKQAGGELRRLPADKALSVYPICESVESVELLKLPYNPHECSFPISPLGTQQTLEMFVSTVEPGLWLPHDVVNELKLTPTGIKLTRWGDVFTFPPVKVCWHDPDDHKLLTIIKVDDVRQLPAKLSQIAMFRQGIINFELLADNWDKKPANVIVMTMRLAQLWAKRNNIQQQS
jgi:hypothetical protein